tara:strand:- start:704 stop:988 length:285 start_codon:yes stop_codon:yes gene_type:complete
LTPQWIVKAHPIFSKDLSKLSPKDLHIFYKKKDKIRNNPERGKHLSGGYNCYREPITSNIRLIYAIKGNIVLLLTIGTHDEAYKNYLKRFFSLE